MSDQATTQEELSALEALADEPATETEEAEEAAAPEPKAEPELTDEEQQAAKGGWQPKGQYSGPEAEWVDAGEFLRRQPLYDRIKKAERKYRDVEKKLEGTTKFIQGIEERVRSQTLQEIEAERTKAVEDGDVEAFTAADKKYQEAQKPVEPEPAEPELPEEVQAFATRNSAWFEKNAAMTEDAVTFTKFYRGKGMELDAALVEVEKDIKRKYPEFFTNPNQRRPQTVSPGNRGSDAKQRGYNDLNDDQKSVYAAIKAHVTLKEYIKELEEQGAFE